MSAPELDPVQVEIIRNALVAAAEEMGVTIWRTSRSSVVRDLLDYSTCVFDAEGGAVGQSTAIPMHLNSMPSCLAEILANHIPIEEWEDGDIIITNDPYAGGQHLSDIQTFKPVFHEGRRIAIAGVLVHHLDVGGGAAGSYDPSATEIQQEGFRIPPLKIAERGKRNEAVVKLLLRNTREPANVGGDFASQLAALETGTANLKRVVTRYGPELLSAAMARIQDQSEAAMRAMIRDVPDGVYTFEDFLDDDGIDRDIQRRIAVKLTIAGDSMEIDLTGSSPQAKGPVNCTLAMSYSAAMCGVLMSLGTEIPANAGCYRPATVKAPLGTVVNCRAPAPVANRMAVGHRVVNAVMGAFHQAIPGRIPAAYYGVSYATSMNCIHADGSRQVYFDLECGGWGGHPDEDGASGFSCGLHNISNAPIEMLENSLPIQFQEYGLVPDSGGKGRTRGGLGLARAYRLEAPAGVFAANLDRFKVRPYGLAGGEPGQPGRLTVTRAATGKTEDLPSKISSVPAVRGDIFRLQTAGGGGYGDPAERSAAAKALDVENGYTSG
jgi:N-methylhydantoinase B